MNPEVGMLALSTVLHPEIWNVSSEYCTGPIYTYGMLALRTAYCTLKYGLLSLSTVLTMV